MQGAFDSLAQKTQAGVAQLPAKIGWTGSAEARLGLRSEPDVLKTTLTRWFNAALADKIVAAAIRTTGSSSRCGWSNGMCELTIAGNGS